MDRDNKMDPVYIPSLIGLSIRNKADYTKENRLTKAVHTVPLFFSFKLLFDILLNKNNNRS